MYDMFKRFLTDPRSQAFAWGIALIYLLVYQFAVSDLSIDGTVRPFSMVGLSNWQDVVFRTRVPFQFEAIGVMQGPFFTWLLSPVNLAIGLALGLLTGAQIALVGIARKCAASCGLSPVAGILSGLPGLLAGSACCAPLLFILLGIQLTASLVTLMGVMIPIAFVLLLGGLVFTLRVAARRCGEVDELLESYQTEAT